MIGPTLQIKLLARAGRRALQTSSLLISRPACRPTADSRTVPRSANAMGNAAPGARRGRKGYRFDHPWSAAAATKARMSSFQAP